MQLLRQSVGRMNTLILFGSPKRNGNTAQLCGAFLQGLPKNNTVEIVRLFDLNPKPCNDCGYCKASDGCSKKDLDAFMQKFQEADLIVVASPVYLCSFPAPMKALFDRFQRFYCARFRRGIETPAQKSGFAFKRGQRRHTSTANDRDPGKTCLFGDEHGGYRHGFGR